LFGGGGGLAEKLRKARAVDTGGFDAFFGKKGVEGGSRFFRGNSHKPLFRPFKAFFGAGKKIAPYADKPDAAVLNAGAQADKLTAIGFPDDLNMLPQYASAA
jgi:hypothetical protein